MIDPALPRIDLHRHLDGNVRLATILELGAKHGIALPGTTVETLRPHVQVEGVMPDLVSWLAKLHWMTAVLGDLDACRRIARENVEDAHRDGLDYVELRFSPAFIARPNGLDPAAVVEAVIAGIDEGRAATGLHVNLIGILSRTFGPDACTVELEALLAQREHIGALDLAGDELAWPAKLFAEHFWRARTAGWAITVHAGEAGDAASVWSALLDLGADRIGHGTHAIDDPELLDHLASHGIGVEVALTSNVQTATVAGYADHPIKRFLAHGIRATLNSDDPVISGIDWTHELAVAAPAAGLDEAEIEAALRNALDVAFVSDEERAAIVIAARVRAAGAGTGATAHPPQPG
jgi:adenosine deaminase